jgi:hypothetical protein
VEPCKVNVICAAMTYDNAHEVVQILRRCGTIVKVDHPSPPVLFVAFSTPEEARRALEMSPLTFCDKTCRIRPLLHQDPKITISAKQQQAKDAALGLPDPNEVGAVWAAISMLARQSTAPVTFKDIRARLLSQGLGGGGQMLGGQAVAAAVRVLERDQFVVDKGDLVTVTQRGFAAIRTGTSPATTTSSFPSTTP